MKSYVFAEAIRLIKIVWWAWSIRESTWIFHSIRKVLKHSTNQTNDWRPAYIDIVEILFKPMKEKKSNQIKWNSSHNPSMCARSYSLPFSYTQKPYVNYTHGTHIIFVCRDCFDFISIIVVLYCVVCFFSAVVVFRCFHVFDSCIPPFPNGVHNKHQATDSRQKIICFFWECDWRQRKKASM